MEKMVQTPTSHLTLSHHHREDNNNSSTQVDDPQRSQSTTTPMTTSSHSVLTNGGNIISRTSGIQPSTTTIPSQPQQPFAQMNNHHHNNNHNSLSQISSSTFSTLPSSFPTFMNQQQQQPLLIIPSIYSSPSNSTTAPPLPTPPSNRLHFYEENSNKKKRKSSTPHHDDVQQQEKKLKSSTTTTTTTLNQQQRCWTLGILPTQVLFEIMSYLTKTELLRNVGKVSKHFHRTSRCNLLWKFEDISKIFPKLVSMQALVMFHCQVFGMYHSVSPFEQVVLHSIDECALHSFLSIFVHLKKIKIMNRINPMNPSILMDQQQTCKLKSEAVLKMSQTFRALIDVDISAMDLVEIEPILAALSNRLEHLNLDHVKVVTFDHVHFLLSHCKNLKTLKCHHTPRFSVTSDQLKQLSLDNKAKNLTTLVIRFLNVDSIDHISLFTKSFLKLKFLWISNWNDMNAIMLSQVMNDLQFLETLRIECSENTMISQPITLNNPNLSSLSISKVKKLSNLLIGPNACKKFSLIRFESISNLDLPIIENEFTTIESFVVRSSSLNIFQTDRVMTALDRCEKLDILDLQSTTTQFTLTSKMLTNVQMFMCDQLSSIKFNKCSQLSTVSIDACEQLTELEMCEVPKLTELVLFKIPSESHPILHTLKIDSGELFTNLQISRCVNLRNLNLNCPNLSCINLTDCKILENINLNGMKKLTKVAISLSVYPRDQMTNLFNFFNNVEYLSISNANHLNDHVLSEYMSRAHNLQALVLSHCHGLVSPCMINHSIKGMQLLNMNRLENVQVSSDSLSKFFLRNAPNVRGDLQLETPKLRLIQVQNCPLLPSVTLLRGGGGGIQSGIQSGIGSSDGGSDGCNSWMSRSSSGSNSSHHHHHEVIHQAHFEACPSLNHFKFKALLSEIDFHKYKLVIEDYLMKDCSNQFSGFFMTSLNDPHTMIPMHMQRSMKPSSSQLVFHEQQQHTKSSHNRSSNSSGCYLQLPPSTTSMMHHHMVVTQQHPIILQPLPSSTNLQRFPSSTPPTMLPSFVPTTNPPKEQIILSFNPSSNLPSIVISSFE